MNDENENEPKQLLNQQEAAALIGVHYRTIRRAELAGDGPPVIRRGRIVRYEKDALLAWFKGGQKGDS